MADDTEHEISTSFEHERGSARGKLAAVDRVSAYPDVSRHATFPARRRLV